MELIILEFIKCDIFSKSTKDQIITFFRQTRCIISDMAADTTGSKSLDSIRTNQLCSEALFLSSKILKPKGVFVSSYLWVRILLKLN